ncbi:hypothetical protein DesfrDRAFT_1379 [Solidesulfovibrio fructosivorans JJ]]|uniref:Uncharacterized protein n=1 Tax=Solidesulfovibrio fructosivorans JJ] TaxID=596151 RepID=E1JUT0_SOLFR|nr:hypothetical protein [Solidesulfovibrio fructosivorans]EFL51844.1 hypothetical protein DesfrDRAFT_1379 [Solidesulfovibrio fructosivorans JJ]]
MELLTQYYNEGGQIASKAPGMDTREFYRDVLCQHEFNEMFVGCTESVPLSYFVSSEGIVLSFGKYLGGKRPETIMHSGNDAPGYIIVDGPNGGKAITLSWSGAGSSKTLEFYCKPSPLVDLSGSDLRFRSIIKSPPLLEDYPGSTYLLSSFNSTGLTGSFSAYSFGPGGYLTADIFSIMYGDANEDTVSAMFDGEWHIYDILINIGRKSQYLIDGSVILEQSSTDYYNGVCPLDTIWFKYDSDSQETGMAIQSISITRV